MAGIVDDIRTRPSRRGRLAIVSLDDGTATLEITVYSELLNQCGDTLTVNELIVVEGECAEDRFSSDLGLNAERMWTLEAARRELARALLLRLAEQDFRNGLLEDLKKTFERAAGGQVPVFVEYASDCGEARIRLGSKRISLSSALLSHLRNAVGSENVTVQY